MRTITKLSTIAFELLPIAALAVLLSITVAAVRFTYAVDRLGDLTSLRTNLVHSLDELDKTLAESRRLSYSIRTAAENIKFVAQESYADTRAAARASLAVTQQTAELVRGINREVLGHGGAVAQFSSAASNISTAANSLPPAVKDISRSISGAGDNLNEQITVLASDLQSLNLRTQLAIEDFAAVARTTDQTISVLAADVHALNGPALKSFENIARSTHHVAEVSETIDIATKPWRKPAHWLKNALKTGAGFFRLTVPLI